MLKYHDPVLVVVKNWHSIRGQDITKPSPQESCKRVQLYLHQSLYFSEVNRADAHRQVKDVQKLEKTAFQKMWSHNQILRSESQKACCFGQK